MNSSGYIFVNEAFNNSINNYFKYKDTPNCMEFNTFDVVVSRIIVWLYGELDITNCYKTSNEHGMGGLDMNMCKFGYPDSELSKFKNNFQKYYDFQLKNEKNAIKEKNIYFDIVQKNLIDMFFYKYSAMNLGVNETNEFCSFLFNINSTDFYKKTLSILLSNDPYDICYYFNLKIFKMTNNYTFSLYRYNLLDLAIYDFFGIEENEVTNFTQKQINSVNSQMYEYFQIAEDDPNRLDLLITAINNTRRKPKIELKY